MVTDNNDVCPHQVHIISDGKDRMHDISVDCPCGPVPEIEQDEDGKEVVFVYHNDISVQ